MFEAVGGKIPAFAHLPLLTGKEGKLSKRLGSLGVRELRADGVEPMAISSFLAKLGTSDPVEPFYSLKDLAGTLDFAKIGRAQPKFDEEELKHFNTRLIHAMPYAMVKERFSVTEEFWNAVRGNLDKLSDIKMWSDICFAELSPIMEDAELTNMAAELLPAEPWNEETFGAWLNEVKTQSGKKAESCFIRCARR